MTNKRRQDIFDDPHHHHQKKKKRRRKRKEKEAAKKLSISLSILSGDDPSLASEKRGNSPCLSLCVWRFLSFRVPIHEGLFVPPWGAGGQGEQTNGKQRGSVLPAQKKQCPQTFRRRYFHAITLDCSPWCPSFPSLPSLSRPSFPSQARITTRTQALAASSGRKTPGGPLGAPRLFMQQHRRNRGGGDPCKPKPPKVSALTLPWRGASSPSEDDPDDYSSRSEVRSFFLDEDDYELTDEELEAKMPRSSSARSSSSSSSSFALRGGGDGDENKSSKSPLTSLALAARSRLGRGARRLRARARRATADLPDDLLGRALWLWESRPVARARLAVSVAAAGARAPALVALIASQAGGVVASTQLSLPVVAPLLIGLPVFARSVAANASAVAPRAAAAALLLWLAWFCNKVATSTALYLRRQGALDARIAGAVVACSEVLALSAASLVLLSALGVNVSALLFPAAALAGWAAADGARCFGAGAFLFAAQPFRLGDRVAVRAPSVPVSSSASGVPPAQRNLGGGGNGSGSAFSAGGAEEQEGREPPSSSSWFDGRVEHVDLRYTVVRKGNARMFLPNSSFLTREFLVFDQEPLQVRDVFFHSFFIFEEVSFFKKLTTASNCSKNLENREKTGEKSPSPCRCRLRWPRRRGGAGLRRASSSSGTRVHKRTEEEELLPRRRRLRRRTLRLSPPLIGPPAGQTTGPGHGARNSSSCSSSKRLKPLLLNSPRSLGRRGSSRGLLPRNLLPRNPLPRNLLPRSNLLATPSLATSSLATSTPLLSPRFD